MDISFSDPDFSYAVVGPGRTAIRVPIHCHRMDSFWYSGCSCSFQYSEKIAQPPFGEFLKLAEPAFARRVFSGGSFLATHGVSLAFGGL